MKTKEELREWFWDKFNSCYRIECAYIKGNYLLYYNKAYVRQRKIQTILGLDIKEPTEVLSDSKFSFKLDYKNGYLWCSNDEIWTFFEDNYSFNYVEIRQFITCLLEEATKTRLLRAERAANMRINGLELYIKG